MKFSRRNIFGLAAGAAVAGPSVAREAMDYAQTSMDSTSGLKGSYLNAVGRTVVGQGGANALGDPGYIMEHASTLRKVISGERTKRELQQEERQQLQDTTIVYHNIEGLKSVSPAHKFMMSQRATKARYAEANKRQALWSLEELQEQYPLLKLLG